jgi:hypothetical protein
MEGMAIEPLPFIAEDDYHAFRAMVPTLPATYAQWLALQRLEVKQYQSVGDQTQHVQIFPATFAQFLRRWNRGGTMLLLQYFAMEVAARPQSAQNE